MCGGSVVLRELGGEAARPGQGGTGVHDHERHHQRRLLPLHDGRRRCWRRERRRRHARAGQGPRRCSTASRAPTTCVNSLMSAGLHHRWRELGVMVAQVEPGGAALDVCCGTGDFAFALRRAVGPQRTGGGTGLLRGDAARGSGEVRPQPVVGGLRAGGPPRSALRRRRVRRLHGGLRHPQRARHRPGLRRDAARGAPGRPRGLPGDHPARASSASSSSTTSGSTAWCRCSAG